MPKIWSVMLSAAMWGTAMLGALIAASAAQGQPPAAPATGVIVITSDSAAALTLDGESRGVLQSNQETRFTVPPGEHQISVQALQGSGSWEEIVEAEDGKPKPVQIPLARIVHRAEIQRKGYWIDAGHGRAWAAADNGSGVSWSQAQQYCSQLRIDGLPIRGEGGWRLPSIDELAQIFGDIADDQGYRVVAPLKLTGWQWSSTPGNEPGEGWVLDFGDGGRASVAAGDSGMNRALCVRSISY